MVVSGKKQKESKQIKKLRERYRARERETGKEKEKQERESRRRYSKEYIFKDKRKLTNHKRM